MPTVKLKIITLIFITYFVSSHFIHYLGQSFSSEIS